MRGAVTLLLTALIVGIVDSFQPIIVCRGRRRVSLNAKAKRKRRKRKAAPASENQGVSSRSAPSPPPPPDPAVPDLPDFDLEEKEDVSVSQTVADAPKQTTVAANSSPDEITPLMMKTSSSSAPVRSIDDLIRDRKLESKFEFDESEADPDIPDLAQLMQQSGAPAGNKKAARREAAIARDAAAETEKDGNLLAKVPFVTNDEGEVNFTKVLEAGAWAGIGLLVLWEVYINSPFFDRVAPMAPVVY